MRQPFSLLALLVLPAIIHAQANTGHEFFESKVRPVLVEHCLNCHGPKKQQAELRMDQRESLVRPGEEGPALVPGQPDKSRFIQVLTYQGDVRMPPKGKLPQHVIDDLTTWVKMGAPWPQASGNVKSATSADAKNHWAFRPVRAPAPPKVKNPEWVQTPVDAFILARLEAKNLAPNPAADRRTLLRRVKLDLIGLPPIQAEIDAFEADRAPDAYPRLVDRLLQSPGYGERWARHWLDVARYADNKGYVFEEERRYPYSYTYRDYVVRAFNDDVPFDRFIVEQLAGDRLVELKQADVKSQAALGFLTLGRRFLNNTHDIIDDRIDVLSRGLLGLTVTCARCHDHKFDPIPSKDYYSLYGVFASSTEPKELPLLGEPERTEEYVAFEKKLGELENIAKEFADKNQKELKENNRKFRDELRALQKKVDAFKVTSSVAPPRGMVLRDLPKPVEPHVFLRGNPNNAGPQVPRQFLEVLAGENRRPFKDGSGRLELAQAIADRNNPLTARVLVNRVWLNHFGAGLVTTPSDFGVRSEPPSHPELLDYLAGRFMDDGWSIKKLHRLILLSSTYQLSSAEHHAARAADPENRLLARANRQRLDFEALRDSILFVSGQLDPKMGGPAVEIANHPSKPRRTIYGFIDRQNLPGLFRTFDFANPDISSPQRHQTTVPQQALFLLNSPFTLEQARKLARRPEVAQGTENVAKIQGLYGIIHGRSAVAEELRLGEAFLAEAESLAFQPKAVSDVLSQPLTPIERYAQVLMLSNEFLFVE